mmetsp:Transcript_26387/g.66975  ORF Transcript_26387/g.66975 Transcript_26387/m.66975 type:complete len:201 (+) Transcript_26387:93-695(+)
MVCISVVDLRGRPSERREPPSTTARYPSPSARRATESRSGSAASRARTASPRRPASPGKVAFCSCRMRRRGAQACEARPTLRARRLFRGPAVWLWRRGGGCEPSRSRAAGATRPEQISSPWRCLQPSPPWPLQRPRAAHRRRCRRGGGGGAAERAAQPRRPRRLWRGPGGDPRWAARRARGPGLPRLLRRAMRRARPPAR